MTYAIEQTPPHGAPALVREAVAARGQQGPLLRLSAALCEPHVLKQKRLHKDCTYRIVKVTRLRPLTWE